MPDFNVGYPDAQAERGKFVRLSDAEVLALGMTAETFGKFAILTYQVGSSTAATSGAPASTSPNSVETKQITTAAEAVSSTNFTNASDMHYIELQNNGAQPLWVYHATQATYPSLTAAGLKVLAGAFYSTNHAGDLWVGSATAGMDVRVIGHYSS